MENKQTAVIKIHPQAIKALVNSSWEFANKFFFKKFMINEEEEEFMRNCLKEYYWSIPADEFLEKSNEYFSNFCWEIQITKVEFDNSPDKKMFDPCIWMTWKTKVHLMKVLAKNNLDTENKERVWEKIPVVLFDIDDFHLTKEFVWGRSPVVVDV